MNTMTAVAGGAGDGKQQHQLMMHLHHTLGHHQQQQQPLVSAQQHHTMLQFHHQHPYASLHHSHNHNNHQQLATSQMQFAASQQQPSQHQHHQQQQQSQQYNMNSDYSSSTYHIYDQISDLIIIKQQRMERKRQQEHRRKVILLSLAACLLVAALMFLLIQSLVSTGASSSSTSRADLDATGSRADSNNNNNNNPQAPWVAPPVGPHNHHLHLHPHLGQRPTTNQQTTVIECHGRGQLIAATDECKCDLGYWGDRCEFGSPVSNVHKQPPQQSSALARCLMHNCNGNGQCQPTTGRCLCYPQFAGTQCEHLLTTTSNRPFVSSVVQPIQLGGDGFRDSKCPQDCNQRGQCLSGLCRCFPGFSGPTCQDLQQQQQQQTCRPDTCFANQGECDPASGLCRCKPNFRGPRCEFSIQQDQQQQPDLLQQEQELQAQASNCSQHGQFDQKTRKCLCSPGWEGLLCADETCPSSTEPKLDCGPNGLYDCRQHKCLCQDGYLGELCREQRCWPQCLRNGGQCLEGGQCQCRPGFYGRHCSLNGCPNQCSGRGQCLRVESSSLSSQQQQQQPEWRCQCQPGATGDDCGLLMERQCDDGLDNDRDGLVDCADSECCQDKVCQNSTLCMKSPDPLDILMRKQPSPPTSSFFQRMQFLIEKFSSQIYSNPKDFNDSLAMAKHMDRASVIRGRVTYLRQGVTGVRVSVAGQINLGITLTRDGGYFDLLVNGGGAVVIEFRREPFANYQRAIRLPWNEIVLIEPVELELETPNPDVMLPPPIANDLLITGASTSGNQNQQQASPSCLAHNYRLMRPHIVASPKSSRKSSRRGLSATPSRAVILRQSGMVQQSIQLPASGHSVQQGNQSSAVSLVYISSRANEFMSTISLQLTPSSEQVPHFRLPADLKAIHLRIVIEGNLFEQLFEPQLNLSYTWAWNRRNVYKQKSFGLSTALVAVGYEYFECRHIIWSSRQIQLPGHDLSISDVGQQWNLNIHHRYNYRDAILQRGDGQNFNLKTDKARVVQPIMGNGHQRQPVCAHCEAANEQRLLRPQALVSAADGSLYVGDFNLIRKLEWLPSAGSSSLRQQSQQEQVARTVLELPTTRVPSKYSLALNLADDKLYMTDTDRHQIYLIREQQLQATRGFSSTADVPQPAQTNTSVLGEPTSTNGAPLYPAEDNLVPVVGTGLRCQLEDRANCGDGQSARQARLIEPKALAFDLQGRMYIADGPNVRMVDSDNKIYTILGDYGATHHTKFPCSGEAIPMHKFVPKAPLDLALSPIDDTLHLLDDNVVYKVTQDKRVQVVAGRLSHCSESALSSNNQKRRGIARATETPLQWAQSLVFGQNGDLFIGEDDQRQGVSRVLLVSPEEDTISLYAGLSGEKLAQEQAQGEGLESQHVEQHESSFQEKQRASNLLPLSQQPARATEHKFSSVAALAVDQQGRLLVADKLQLRVLAVEPDLPLVNAANEYELQSPDNPDELLVFNRHGHHIATRETSFDKVTTKYTFAYTLSTPFGQLSSVTYGSGGNKISIYRDGPHHSVRMIETAMGGQCKLDITRNNNQVLSISQLAPAASKINFSYHHADGGLLKQSRDQSTGELYELGYDELGRATNIKHTSPKLVAPLDCRRNDKLSSYLNQKQHQCSALIVDE